MTDDLDALAKGLTKAQREAILCARNGVIPSHYPTAIRIAAPTLRRLGALGLAQGWPSRLTPLGLEVRAILEANNERG